MIRGLLIYAAFVGLSVAGISVGAHVPADTALGVFAIGVCGVVSVLVPLLAYRHRPKRRHDDWPRLGCDHVDRLPPERVVGELVEPARCVRVLPQAQIEAPKRELEVML